MKSAVHLQQLLSGIIRASRLTSSSDLTLTVSFHSSFASLPSADLKYKSPLASPSPFCAFLPLIPTVSSSLTPPFLFSFLLIPSGLQTLCLTGAPITLPRVQHRSITQ
ncbi:hypothetical protein PBY51_007004 [Eleginops maclovinus]|uniref:Uncharacterized protein n=1 Tax=Eleginops maclovinus TaxID=56733 RepID=A0AAN7X5C1_ELEMC|nr:hypothetical protein PBY51_007004 [Eleginops maclovinus]